MSSGQILPAGGLVSATPEPPNTAQTMSAVEYLESLAHVDGDQADDVDRESHSHLFDHEVGCGVSLSSCDMDKGESVMVTESDDETSDEECSGGVMIKEVYMEEERCDETFKFPMYGMSSVKCLLSFFTFEKLISANSLRRSIGNETPIVPRDSPHDLDASPVPCPCSRP